MDGLLSHRGPPGAGRSTASWLPKTVIFATSTDKRCQPDIALRTADRCDRPVARRPEAVQVRTKSSAPQPCRALNLGDLT
jgi:hypothetical protein